ncbi:hypothetical protein MLD38_007503 [Melastoma candidum]|uniref:Uncharacterized protein n=1 Tax=Melastoma candidum TaxID=119954 RepID=A0ACB9RQZ4_9MYRT|nr:hypothetical protein MLD38_007503 [Melastoma candidum]
MVVCGKERKVDLGCKYDIEGDAYYAELEKQILEIMAGDGEDAIVISRGKVRGNCSSDSVQLNGRLHPAGIYGMPDWSSYKKSSNVGTGVFIPQIIGRLIPGDSRPESRTKNTIGRSRRCRQKKRKDQSQPGTKCQEGADQNLHPID